MVNLVWDAVLFSFGIEVIWKKKLTGEELKLQGVYSSRPMEAKLGSEITLYGTSPRFVIPMSQEYPKIQDTLFIHGELYSVASTFLQPDIDSISLELKKIRA